MVAIPLEVDKGEYIPLRSSVVVFGKEDTKEFPLITLYIHHGSPLRSSVFMQVTQNLQAIYFHSKEEGGQYSQAAVHVMTPFFKFCLS